MDEKKLAEMFREAAADAPPPTFDSGDVEGAAQRADARHRSRVLGGSSVAVVVLAVGLMIGFLDLGHTGGGQSTAVAPPPASSPRPEFNAATPGHPRAGALNGTESGAHNPDSPGSPPTQGGGTPGETGPGAGTAPSGCGPTDGELADALAGELPSVGVSERAPAAVPGCPAGSRTAGYLVHDGTATGRISAVLAPAGQHPAIPAGATVGSAATAAGRELTVVTVPNAGSPAAPLAAKVQTIAQALASRF